MAQPRSFFRPRLVGGTAKASPSALRPTPAAAGSAPAAPLTADQARAFREVMLPHLNAAYNLARFLARDQAAAEDIVQTAFLKAYAAFPTWRGDHAKAWLFVIVRNGFLTWARSNRNWSDILAPEEDGADVADPDAPSPEITLIRQHDIERLRAVIESLPEPFREALVLRELEEFSYREIAELTGAPVGTVMSRLARARQTLTRLLMQGPEAAR
jgi:RNA polymerase sigma factor (sigma-70 family)